MLIEIGNKTQSDTFEAYPGEKLLYAGLRAGLPLPYECATGTCGTCKGRLKEGEIHSGWENAPGKKTLKPKRHEFLLCQATASTRCKIGISGDMHPFRHDDISPDHQIVTIGDWSEPARDIRRFFAQFPEPVHFHAGQYFVLQAPNLPGFRAYSMVNYADRTHRLEFVIKRLSGGGFSEWAFHCHKSVEGIHAFGPLGRATFHPDEGCSLWLIGGGSGIAGLLSILSHAQTSNHLQNRQAHLFFGVRTTKDLFFMDRLCKLQSDLAGNLTVTVVFSHEAHLDRNALPSELNWSTGFVHEVAIASLNEDSSSRDNLMVYLAGPPPMVDGAIRSLILEARVPPSRIRYDKFS